MYVKNGKSYAKNDTFCFKGKNNRAARAARTLVHFFDEHYKTRRWNCQLVLKCTTVKAFVPLVLLSYYTM